MLKILQLGVRNKHLILPLSLHILELIPFLSRTKNFSRTLATHVQGARLKVERRELLDHGAEPPDLMQVRDDDIAPPRKTVELLKIFWSMLGIVLRLWETRWI